VLTRGDRGALAFCSAGEARVAARPVAVVDTIGAGDAFMVGLLDALWGLDLLGGDRRAGLGRSGLGALAAVLQAAAPSSAFTVGRAGADLPDRAAVDRQSASRP